MARNEISQQPSYEVPTHLRNAPTALMNQLGYGKAYRYAHDEPHAYAAGEVYFPDDLEGTQYYFPVDRGLEVKIKEKLDYLAQLNDQFQRDSK